VNVAYVGLADYVAITAEITGLDVETILRFPRLGLADSALHAPAAGFGETEFYPDLIDKAAVLIVHLAKNHPLPDGNKRAAWVTMRVFLEINGWTWRTPPTIDDAEHAVLAVAAGDWDHPQMATWLRDRLQPPSSTTE
jgi:death-on-curing protein